MGQEFSNSSSNEIIQSLFKTGLFSDISVSRDNNSLNINLIENPIIKYFEVSLDTGTGFSNWIRGEKMFFTADALNDEINNNDLSAGNPVVVFILAPILSAPVRTEEHHVGFVGAHETISNSQWIPTSSSEPSGA